MIGIQTKKLVMMKQQPDIFFREKLQGYQKSMPANAWEKIETNLNEKRNKRLWAKIAASILILTAASYVVWQTSSPEIDSAKNAISYHPANEKIFQKRTEDVKLIAPIKDDRNSKLKRLVSNKISSNNAHLKLEIQNESIKPNSNTDARPVSVNNLLIEFRSERDTLTSNADDLTRSNEITSQINPVADHITLVYTVDEVQEKYLDKNSIEEATNLDKKPSALKKLLSKVYDLKNDQHPFGDLRQKKDEILALNFKKRTEN